MDEVYDSIYTMSALSLKLACKVAYFRGQVAEKLQAAILAQLEAMMLVNLLVDQVSGYLGIAGLSALSGSINVTCI